MSDDEYFREENPEEKPEDPPEINWGVDDDGGGDGGDDGGGGQGGSGQGGGGNAGAGQISQPNRDSVFSLRGEEAGQADGPEAAIRGPSKSAQHWHCASYVRRRDG